MRTKENQIGKAHKKQTVVVIVTKENKTGDEIKESYLKQVLVQREQRG